VTFLFVALLALRCIVTGKHALIRKTGAIMAGLLLLQIALGISNVIFSLPLPVAAAHNGVAALLLLSVITVIILINTKLGR
jgi:cytochrome c oxidase assembly protein subunit 15